MSENKYTGFEKQLRDSLQGYEEEYNSTDWADMEKRLDATSPVKGNYSKALKWGAAAVAAAGKPVTLIVAEGYNHFELREDYGNPYGVIGRSVLEQMRLG